MPKNRITTGILQPREETGKLLTPDNLAGEVFNMRITEEGTLRSLEGPAPWLPATGGQGSLIYPSPQEEMHGIYHHAFDNRDMLLLHSGAAVYAFEGWKKRWGGGVPGKGELLKDDTSLMLLVLPWAMGQLLTIILQLICLQISFRVFLSALGE